MVRIIQEDRLYKFRAQDTSGGEPCRPFWIQVTAIAIGGIEIGNAPDARAAPYELFLRRPMAVCRNWAGRNRGSRYGFAICTSAHACEQQQYDTSAASVPDND